MRTTRAAQTCFSTALVLILGVGVSGCAPTTQPHISTDSALTSCGEIMPKEVAADVLGPGGRLVQLQAEELDAVSPLVDTMVTDGIACGGSVNGAVLLDGAVMIGQLAINQEEWNAIQTAFAADGHVAIDDIVAGWVYVSKSTDDPTLGSGFVWRDGVLYYMMNPMMLALVPAFASEFASEGGTTR